MTSTVADPAASEPLTLDRLVNVCKSLPPLPERPWWAYAPRFQHVEPDPEPVWNRIPFRWNFGPVMRNPKPIVIWDLGTDRRVSAAPAWKRVPCLARGGRKMRRKVYRQVPA